MLLRGKIANKKVYECKTEHEKNTFHDYLIDIDNHGKIDGIYQIGHYLIPDKKRELLINSGKVFKYHFKDRAVPEVVSYQKHDTNLITGKHLNIDDFIDVKDYSSDYVPLLKIKSKLKNNFK